MVHRYIFVPKWPSVYRYTDPAYRYMYRFSLQHTENTYRYQSPSSVITYRYMNQSNRHTDTYYMYTDNIINSLIGVPICQYCIPISTLRVPKLIIPDTYSTYRYTNQANRHTDTYHSYTDNVISISLGIPICQYCIPISTLRVPKLITPDTYSTYRYTNQANRHTDTYYSYTDNVISISLGVPIL